ncbi:hypothetical protein SLA2020_263910 [Shorea laevis]
MGIKKKRLNLAIVRADIDDSFLCYTRTPNRPIWTLLLVKKAISTLYITWILDRIPLASSLIVLPIPCCSCRNNASGSGFGGSRGQ